MLALIRIPPDDSDRLSRRDDLLFSGTLVQKYRAIPQLHTGRTSDYDTATLTLLTNLRHEIMHPLPMPQGLPNYMRPLAERGLLLQNTDGAARHYAPFQLLMSYPLAYWCWYEANEASLHIHEQVREQLNTSSYQLAVGLPVPPQCIPVRWHDGNGRVGEPPVNRWAKRGERR